MLTADVAIAGAGVIGCAIAYQLSRSTRLRIVVIDRGTPGCEASNAAAGVLAVASGQARGGALFDLRRRSAALFPDLVAALRDETSIDLGYRRDGVIALALSDEEASGLQELAHHRVQQGFRCEVLSRQMLRSLEPAANADARAAVLFADDGAINNELLISALVTAARQRGVTFRLESPVQTISTGDGRVQLRLPAETVDAAVGVVAAGAWSAELLAPCGIRVPVRPARGEMAAVRPATWPLHHTLTAGHGYLVPRHGGEVLLGSTTAFAGFDKRPTAAGLTTLLARGEAIVPRLREARLVRSWAGLRPCPTIRRPLITRLPGLDHLILATGHHRNGILLAPITAQLVTEMITGEPSSVPLRPFGFRRH